MSSTQPVWISSQAYERLQRELASLRGLATAAAARSDKPIGRPTNTAERRLGTPAARPVRPPHVVTQPRTPVAQHASQVEPRTVVGPSEARVITCYPN